jgi:transposase
MQVITTRIIQETPHRYTVWKSSDEEKRYLRCAIASKDRALEHHRKKNERLEDELRELGRQLEEERRRNEDLEKILDKTRKQRDRYRDLLFKGTTRGDRAVTHSEAARKTIKKRNRGAQYGHKGCGYQQQRESDKTLRIHLTHCPECEAALGRANGIATHTVEDIPAPEVLKTQITAYEIERQWCPYCQKIRMAAPAEVMPGSRYGIHVLLYIIIQKYCSHAALASISQSLNMLFGLKISNGGIVNMLHRAKKWLGPDYDRLLTEIRGAKIKHADETGWRIEGVGHWIWGFFTKTAAYYRIEESRGKGIPISVLNGSHEHDVLVRDDYAGYKSLPVNHQSCWAHLLRKSHELAVYDRASTEMIQLHQELKGLFNRLEKNLKAPFKLAQRKQLFKQIALSIDRILQRTYQSEDAKEVQTRISNQGTNLITALLFDGVPLTNNLAERLLRPLVVQRKMSGGSKTVWATHTHMVLMSIIESFKLKNMPLLPSLKSALLAAAAKN